MTRLAREAVGFKQVAQIGLGADGLGEDHRLALAALADDLVEHLWQAFQQGLALGVGVDPGGEVAVAGQFSDLGFQGDWVDLNGDGGGLVFQRIRLGGLIALAPFVGGLGHAVDVVERVLGDRLHAFQPPDHLVQGRGDGERRRPQNLPQDERHEVATVLADRERALALKVGGHVIVEVGFQPIRREVEGLGQAICVVDQARLLDLPPQGALADRLQPVTQDRQRLAILPAAELGPEGVGRAEELVVDDGDEAVKLHQVVLQRRRRQQQLLAIGQGVPQHR